MLLLASLKIRRSIPYPKNGPKEYQWNIELEHLFFIISIFVGTGLFDGLFKENKKAFPYSQYNPTEDFHGLSETQTNMKPKVLQITVIVSPLLSHLS